MGELFTIGYEGRSIEDYMDLLADSQVKVLCDVRKNPISRKPGFSKNRLRENCESRGIEYRHFPDLGVDSERRKHLDSDEAYVALFRFYELNILKQAADCLTEIFNLLKDEGNVALTCFEINADYCHRGCISGSMLKEYALPTVVDL